MTGVVERTVRRIIPVWGVSWRLGALIATAGLLIATSAPLNDCDEWSAVALQAQGSCGPGGLIVVESGEGQGIQIHNAAALGLPPLDGEQQMSTQAYARLNGWGCPRQFEEGRWEVVLPACAAGTDGGPPTSDGGTGAVGDGGASVVDGGASTGDGGVSGSAACGGSCQAELSAAGILVFTCRSSAGIPRCQSSLTRVP